MPLKYFDGNTKFNVKLRAETVAVSWMAVLWTTYNDLFIFDRTLSYSWKVNVFMEVSSSILHPRSHSLASLHPVPIQPPSPEDPSLYSPAISFVHLIFHPIFGLISDLFLSRNLFCPNSKKLIIPKNSKKCISKLFWQFTIKDIEVFMTVLLLNFCNLEESRIKAT